ncbi:MAG: UPF0149 family protein [Candidatus Thiodiazotropha sp. (ex Dulcina madagascariensis)]|nr:UPF0149 family protein [Candidatus Thiodiazotropha sp. (ex Epidulcina cf. delphinae)]MCU7934753.1 UPF0149 family protein [Candidatus Thiodiazotropha sp. (ex Dulcina madagascariensis)]
MKNLTQPLDDAEMDELDSFLFDRVDEETYFEGKDEGLLGLAELDGYFTAIVSGPETLVPSQWLPAIWGDDEPDWVSPEAYEKIFALLIRHFNGVVSALMDPSFEFQPIFNEREVDGRKYTIVDGWCLGYMKGMALCPKAWDEGGEEVFEMLQPIFLFSDEPGWEILDQMEEDEVIALQEAIPLVARNIHGFWLERREITHPADIPAEVAIHIRPDDPCPCGSGKPYGKCCLH